MARPRVFISSTFYNLKQVRASLEDFVRSIGYDPIITDNITYLPDQPLDESCYLEAGSCDLFVLIIGGRYGSEVSESDSNSEKAFYDRYKSITRREFESALQRDVPIYVLVDRAVQGDYQTFLLNRGNETVKYAHVDSVNVFELIEFIRTETQKPVHEFEKASEIVEWLTEQWGGLFQKMLSDRSEGKRLSSLELQVRELENIATTMKRYLEEIVGSSVAGRGEAIIAEEETRLKERRIDNQLLALAPFRNVIDGGLPVPVARQIFAEAASLDDLTRQLKSASGKAMPKPTEEIVEHLRREPHFVEQINEARTILGREPLGFESTGKG